MILSDYASESGPAEFPFNQDAALKREFLSSMENPTYPKSLQSALDRLLTKLRLKTIKAKVVFFFAGHERGEPPSNKTV